MQNSLANRFGVVFMLCTFGVPVFAYQRKAAQDAPAKAAEGAPAKAAQDTPPEGRRRRGGESADAKSKDGKAEKTVYDYSLAGADGKDLPLSSFKGKVILLVNLGRNSSYNDQLAGLIKISEKYKDKGLVVIGVPSNDFGAAEPGTDAEIQKFYVTDDKVPFLITAKSLLIGDEALPLYIFLSKEKGAPAGGGAAGGASGGEAAPARGGGGGGAAGGATNVHWNYTKFLIDRTGKVTRFEPDVAPDSPEMLATLDEMFTGGGGGGGRSRPRPDQTAKSNGGGDAGNPN
jgi:glutathione peroxidase